MKPAYETSLTAALAFRQPLAAEFADATTTALRLFCGEGEGIAGFVVDRFNSVLVFQVHEGVCPLSPSEVREVAEWLLNRTGARSGYLKQFVPDRSSETANQAMYVAGAFVGEESPAEIEIRENGVRYLIKPFDGFSTGLFLDQRANRQRLAQGAAGKEVLNGFSYTCGFSAACALSGALVTSVDLSKKYLEWGKKNFELNGLDLARHRFIDADMISFLGREGKKGKTYDLVILDPPSFSRTKTGGVFSLKKDLPKLLSAALAVVKAGGELFFSCNLAAWDSNVVKKAAKSVAAQGTRLEWHELPATPLDFQRQTTALSAFFAKVNRG